jgi:signal transduction histidine kinase
LAALGSVNEKLENQTKSLDYNTQSLKLAEKLKYKTGIAYALGNVAMNYGMQGDFEKAEQYLKKSISLKHELGDKWGAIGSDIDLSKLYIKWKKPVKAMHVLEKTLKIAIEVDSKTRLLEIYKNMSTVYDQLNDPITAYSFTKKYISLKDSLLNDKTVEEMGQSKRRYEIQKHQLEITMLKKENELLGKNKMIQKLQVYILAIAGLFFASFLWWYRKKLKYQSNINKLLEEKNDILNIKNEEIHVKNKQLKNSNDDLQQFAYVASHDLKEPIRMIGSYSTLLKKRYHQTLDDTGKEFLYYIVDGVSRMETLLNDLLDFSRVGNQPAPTDFIAVNDLMVIITSNLRQLFENLNGTLIVRTENLPTIKAHKTQLIQLLQNLVSNGVKFKGERDPVVIVDCEKKEDRYVFSVKDNGIGISKENQEKVFEMFRRLHTREEYEGTGIGLAICKRIVKLWGGDIWIESIEGEGTTFFFTFPIAVEEPVLIEEEPLLV